MAGFEVTLYGRIWVTSEEQIITEGGYALHSGHHKILCAEDSYRPTIRDIRSAT